MEHKQDLTELAKQQIKKHDGFIKANNFNIIKVEEHYCELEGLITDTSTNPYGNAHGGFIFGLADTAAGIASMTDGRTAVTLSSTIDYLKAAKGTKLIAIASCSKVGKNVSFFEVKIYDEEENLVAKSNINYFYVA